MDVTLLLISILGGFVGYHVVAAIERASMRVKPNRSVARTPHPCTTLALDARQTKARMYQAAAAYKKGVKL